jgi:hypothetical protein
MPNLRLLALIAPLVLTAACSRDSAPLLGDWEIDPSLNDRGVLLAVEAAEMGTLRFERSSISSPRTAIPVSYLREDDLVRVVREDGRGEHAVHLLPDETIRVELPIGVEAIYRRSSD